MSNLLTKHTETHDDGSETVFEIWDNETNQPKDDFDSYCLYRIREKRNLLLKDSDWTQGSDSTLSASKKTEWANYRQQLRDFPVSDLSSKAIDNIGNVINITWPTKPT